MPGRLRGRSISFHEDKIKARGRYRILDPVIVIDGRVVGTWKRKLEKDRVAIKTDFFVPPGKTREKAVVAAARRFGEFVSLSVEC